jgi:hypothetical protein
MDEIQIAASVLGKAGRGKAKVLSVEERESRRVRLEEARKWRWVRHSIVRYEISGDGLVAKLKDGNTFHIHSDELSELEKWIKGLLVYIVEGGREQ